MGSQYRSQSTKNPILDPHVSFLLLKRSPKVPPSCQNSPAEYQNGGTMPPPTLKITAQREKCFEVKHPETSEPACIQAKKFSKTKRNHKKTQASKSSSRSEYCKACKSAAKEIKRCIWQVNARKPAAEGHAAGGEALKILYVIEAWHLLNQRMPLVVCLKDWQSTAFYEKICLSCSRRRITRDGWTNKKQQDELLISSASF